MNRILIALVFFSGYLCSQTVDVKDMGAYGDNVHDDTAILQQSISIATASGTKTGNVFFPCGQYVITQTLTYTGNPSLALNITTEGSDKGMTCASLVWKGAAGGTALKLTGMNGSTINGLAFNGVFGMKRGIWMVGPASSGNVIRRVTMANFQVASDASGIAFGDPANPSTQVSEVSMYDLILIGPGMGSAIVSLTGNNVKNFHLTGGTITNFGTGINWANASGVFRISGLTLSQSALEDFHPGAGVMSIEGVESECIGCRFINGTTGGNPGSVTVTGSSWESVGAADDIAVAYQGVLVLTGNKFLNYRTANSVPKITVQNPLMSDTIAPGSLVAIGNFFLNGTSNPNSIFSDYANSIPGELAGSGYYYATRPTNTYGFGNTAGYPGHIVKMLPFMGSALFNQSQ